MKLTHVFAGVLALASLVTAAQAQTTVANIAEAQTVGVGTDIIIAGPVVITETVNTIQPTRNQFTIQDNSGPSGTPRGILIDDNGNLLNQGDFATGRVRGNTITGLRLTRATDFNAQRQFNPNADQSTATLIVGGPGDVPAPFVVTNATTFDEIDSVLVRVNGVAPIGLPATWAVNQSTNITMEPGFEQTAIAQIRFQNNQTTSNVPPLIGQATPTTTFSVIGTARRFNANFQILPIRLEDIQTTANVEDWMMF